MRLFSVEKFSSNVSFIGIGWGWPFPCLLLCPWKWTVVIGPHAGGSDEDD